ncbi:hypothetical protein BC829DRAFT_400915 [Chytridium lagenaria]|nr:hypothetical protein BC829DRAFT_400915 [Chytridium lagenaria]
MFKLAHTVQTHPINIMPLRHSNPIVIISLVCTLLHVVLKFIFEAVCIDSISGKPYKDDVLVFGLIVYSGIRTFGIAVFSTPFCFLWIYSTDPTYTSNPAGTGFNPINYILRAFIPGFLGMGYLDNCLVISTHLQTVKKNLRASLVNFMGYTLSKIVHFSACVYCLTMSNRRALMYLNGSWEEDAALQKAWTVILLSVMYPIMRYLGVGLARLMVMVWKTPLLKRGRGTVSLISIMFFLSTLLSHSHEVSWNTVGYLMVFPAYTLSRNLRVPSSQAILHPQSIRSSQPIQHLPSQLPKTVQQQKTIKMTMTDVDAKLAAAFVDPDSVINTKEVAFGSYGGRKNTLKSYRSVGVEAFKTSSVRVCENSPPSKLEMENNVSPPIRVSATLKGELAVTGELESGYIPHSPASETLRRGRELERDMLPPLRVSATFKGASGVGEEIKSNNSAHLKTSASFKIERRVAPLDEHNITDDSNPLPLLDSDTPKPTPLLIEKDKVYPTLDKVTTIKDDSLTSLVTLSFDHFTPIDARTLHGFLRLGSIIADNASRYIALSIILLYITTPKSSTFTTYYHTVPFPIWILKLIVSPLLGLSFDVICLWAEGRILGVEWDCCLTRFREARLEWDMGYVYVIAIGLCVVGFVVFADTGVFEVNPEYLQGRRPWR